MAHKREFPITWWSCFYGTCLLVAVAAALISTLTLAGLNHAQFYDAPKNGCWEQNASGMYGQDNIVLCPNTHIVSNVTLIGGVFGLVAHRLDNKPNSTSLVPASPYATIWNTAPLGISSIWWGFWLNHGSTLNISLTNVKAPIEILVNDANHTLVTTDQSVFLKFDEDSQYKVGFQTNGGNSVTLNFQLTTAIYDVPTPPLEDICIPFPNSTFSCSFPIDFRSSQCVNIRMRPGLPRDWKPNNVGLCIIVTTQGFDYIWSGITLPSAAAIVLIMLAAIAIGSGTRRRCQRSKSHPLNEVYSDAPTADDIYFAKQ